ncbi:TetR/AcrR family transcriptional regulator [Paenibacillus sp. FSL K6-1566]|uniref:TetR/AcrR family transcriptional regulator n=1 Tax=Paenibacillus sp. FSL K6-1566 TaxID=2954515 RepID=UPI003100BB55
MSAAEIKQSALARFAQDGYEGASLKHIADDCGIKKPSIYAHFSSKEDLFLQVLADVFERQKQRIEDYFEEHASLPLEAQLKGFVVDWQQIYERDAERKFFLRMVFFPPSALYDDVMNLVYPFLDEQEQKLSRLLAAGCPVQGGIIRHPRQAAIAYLTLLDGIAVEMLYGGEARTTRRLEAAWPVYWSGVSRER